MHVIDLEFPTELADLIASGRWKSPAGDPSSANSLLALWRMFLISALVIGVGLVCATQAARIIHWVTHWGIKVRDRLGWFGRLMWPLNPEMFVPIQIVSLRLFGVCVFVFGLFLFYSSCRAALP
jgi:hypothetical protein